MLIEQGVFLNQLIILVDCLLQSGKQICVTLSHRIIVHLMFSRVLWHNWWFRSLTVPEAAPLRFDWILLALKSFNISLHITVLHLQFGHLLLIVLLINLECFTLDLSCEKLIFKRLKFTLQPIPSLLPLNFDISLPLYKRFNQCHRHLWHNVKDGGKLFLRLTDPLEITEGLKQDIQLWLRFHGHNGILQCN